MNASSSSWDTSELSWAVIPAGAVVHGDLSAEGLALHGEVMGSVRAREVRVESEGRIHGDLEALRVRVAGQVNGIIRADSVEVLAGGSSQGGITSPAVQLHEGCTISGPLETELPEPLARGLAQASPWAAPCPAAQPPLTQRERMIPSLAGPARRTPPRSQPSAPDLSGVTIRSEELR